MPSSRTEWWKDGFEDEENDWYIKQDVNDLDFSIIQLDEKQHKTANYTEKFDTDHVSKPIDNLTTIIGNNKTNKCVDDESDPLTLLSSYSHFDNNKSSIINVSPNVSSSSSSWWEDDENWRPFQGSLQELQSSSYFTTMNPSNCPKNVDNMMLVSTTVCLSIYSIFITILYYRGRTQKHFINSNYHHRKPSQKNDMPLSNNMATKQSTTILTDAHEESCITKNEKNLSIVNTYTDSQKENEKEMSISKALPDKPMMITTSHNEDWFIQQVQSLTTTFSSTGLNRQDSIQLANSTVLKKLELEYMVRTVRAYNYYFC